MIPRFKTPDSRKRKKDEINKPQVKGLHEHNVRRPTNVQGHGLLSTSLLCYLFLSALSTCQWGGVGGSKELSTPSGGPIRKLVAASGESGQRHSQHSTWDKEEKVNFRNSLETDSAQYWNVGVQKRRGFRIRRSQ